MTGDNNNMKKSKTLIYAMLLTMLSSCAIKNKEVNNSSSTNSSSIASSNISSNSSSSSFSSSSSSNHVPTHTYSIFDYSELNDGTIKIEGLNTIVKDITIPDEIKGKKVTILNGGFIGSSSTVETIYIGKNITQLDTSTNGYDGIKFSTDNSGLPNLRKVEVDKENQTFMSINNCILTKNPDIENKIYLVYACKGAIVPSNISNLVIGNRAFGRSNIEVLTIPSNVISFMPNAFTLNYSLNTIISTNDKFEVINGCVVQGNEVIGGAANVTELPKKEGIDTVRDEAFFGSGINSIYIPNTYTTLGKMSFYGSEISSVTFESNSKIKKLGSSFNFTKKLVSFTFPDNYETVDVRDLNGSFVQTVVISKSVKEFNGLENAMNVSTIKVNSSNPYFKTNYSHLVIKNDSTLVYSCMNSLTIYTDIKAFSNHCFYYSPLTKNISFDSATSIDQDSFYNGALFDCNLDSFSFPNKFSTSISSFSKRVFKNSTIGTLTTPTGTDFTTFNNNMILGATIKNLKITSNITHIDYNAFGSEEGNLSKIDDISIPSDSENKSELLYQEGLVYTSRNGGYYIEGWVKTKTKESASLADTVIGYSQYAFANSDIAQITISKTVTSFGAYAFKNCKKLKTLTILSKSFSKDTPIFMGSDGISIDNLNFAFTKDEFLEKFPTKESFLHDFLYDIFVPKTVSLNNTNYTDIDSIWQK